MKRNPRRILNLQIDLIDMTHKLKFSFLLGVFFTFFSVTAFAQLEKGKLVDGIAAVIGDEIILESDIAEQMNYAAQQGQGQMTDKCQVIESILTNKIIVYEAKRDTLIENRSAAIKENAQLKYNQIMAQFPDEKTMLAAYKFRTGFEMRSAIEKIDSDQYYGQAKYMSITDKADVTPNEVTDFYNMYRLELPEVRDEVTLAQISIHPKLTDAHKQEIIDRLKKIKQDILNGESFDSQARIYSEDPGSAAAGGLIKNISKGQMVKPFEAAALNLQEGEISDPVESEFGFHIIQLERKAGKIYDARHILIMATPTAEEIETARRDLDKIRTDISNGKITFKEAAYKYSDDKRTKFNAGILTDNEGSDKMEKINLPPTLGYQIIGLNKGDITEVFEDELNRKKSVSIVKVEEVIPAHQLTIETDYDRIKQMALNKKRNEMVEKWVKQRIPNIFLSIDNRYSNCQFDPDLQKSVLSK